MKDEQVSNLLITVFEFHGECTTIGKADVRTPDLAFAWAQKQAFAKNKDPAIVWYHARGINIGMTDVNRDKMARGEAPDQWFTFVTEDQTIDLNHGPNCPCTYCT